MKTRVDYDDKLNFSVTFEAENSEDKVLLGLLHKRGSVPVVLTAAVRSQTKFKVGDVVSAHVHFTKGSKIGTIAEGVIIDAQSDEQGKATYKVWSSPDTTWQHVRDEDLTPLPPQTTPKLPPSTFEVGQSVNACFGEDRWERGVIAGQVFDKLCDKWIYSVKIGSRTRYHFAEDDLQPVAPALPANQETIVFNIGELVQFRGKDGSTWSGPGTVSGRDFDEVENKWLYSVTNQLGSVFGLTADDLQLVLRNPKPKSEYQLGDQVAVPSLNITCGTVRAVGAADLAGVSM